VSNYSTGVAVRVTFDSEQTHSIEQQREGWQSILLSSLAHPELAAAAGRLLRRSASG